MYQVPLHGLTARPSGVDKHTIPGVDRLTPPGTDASAVFSLKSSARCFGHQFFAIDPLRHLVAGSAEFKYTLLHPTPLGQPPQHLCTAFFHHYLPGLQSAFGAGHLACAGAGHPGPRPSGEDFDKPLTPPRRMPLTLLKLDAIFDTTREQPREDTASMSPTWGGSLGSRKSAPSLQSLGRRKSNGEAGNVGNGVKTSEESKVTEGIEASGRTWSGWDECAPRRIR